MADIDRIDVTWKDSEKGRVCTATAISQEGEILAKAHITLPSECIVEFYRASGNLGDEEIEKAAKADVVFMLDNPELFQ
jgi:ABC-type Fe3+-hydroxamate transport system substrate-binding protein